MAPHSTHSRGVSSLVISRCAAWALGVTLLVGGTPLAAQEARLSAASQIGQGCGTAFSTFALQQDAETQLREAGIAVSRVHTAALATNLDCVPVSGARAVAVHQCLGLSQVVSVPGQGSGVTMATTWRQCQQYTCAGKQCEALARGSQRNLLTAFLGDFREQFTKRAPAAPLAPVQASVAPDPGPVYLAIPRPVLKLSAVFYTLYILTCIAVLVRWEFCR